MSKENQCRPVRAASVALATALLVACTGNIDGAGASKRSQDADGQGVGSEAPGNEPAPGTEPTANPDGSAPQGATVGASSLRRLGKAELRHTVRDLLGALPASFDAAADFPADNGVEQAFALPGTVSDLEVKRLSEMAEAALTALGGGTPGASVACASDETACAQSFVESFGKRAFRRPLSSVEVDDLMALYGKLRSDPDMLFGFAESLDVLVEAMLQSPGFVYRWERGLAPAQRDGTLVKFDAYEMASRLSYFLWNSMPDEALLAAADAGALATPEQVGEQARRLLADARADEAFGDFVTQWLELEPLHTLVKDGAVYPEFTSALRESMRLETLAFTSAVLRGPTPTFSELMTAGYTFAAPELAEYYGASADASGRVDLSGTGRAGLLMQGAFLAVKGNSYRTSPVRRGKLVLNRLLCGAVPPPPPNVVPELPPPDPSLSQREQMAVHREDPACAGCHVTMDALGFAFEHFDGAGKFRDSDFGQPIDASGSVTLDGAELQFAGANDLALALSGSTEAQQCFSRQWLRYAIDRFEHEADAAAVSHLGQAYAAAGLDTRELLVEITKTLPFSHRAPAEGEVLSP